MVAFRSRVIKLRELIVRGAAKTGRQMPMLKRPLIATVMALAIGATGMAMAADKDQVIKDRQDAMKEQGRQAVIIRNYSEGKGDQAAAQAAVEALTKSLPTVPNLFPPGTDGPTPDGKWGTKPEVWTQNDKFQAAIKEVSAQIAAIGVAVKAGDTAKVAADFKELGFCKACHDTFRAKLQ
jgi:cytochrome c556